jgi:hypothetical protein
VPTTLTTSVQSCSRGERSSTSTSSQSASWLGGHTRDDPPGRQAWSGRHEDRAGGHSGRRMTCATPGQVFRHRMLRLIDTASRAAG